MTQALYKHETDDASYYMLRLLSNVVHVKEDGVHQAEG